MEEANICFSCNNAVKVIINDKGEVVNDLYCEERYDMLNSLQLFNLEESVNSKLKKRIQTYFLLNIIIYNI